ncbi:hypothetical protein [Nonomuraea sp. B5E05]|uniref:hypothetical protein n=1 Tax=Nonomuraea sp. B5E05 TaxID=3153569 RepID=UPI0032615A12
MARGWGLQRVREEVGLAVWEVRLAVDTSLTPVAVEEVRKYGRTLVVRYYRAADVELLQARAGEALRRAAHAELNRAAAAEQSAIDAAARAISRLSDDAVAELFGCRST